MCSTRAFHVFIRSHIPIAVFLFLAAVAVLLATGCGGEEPTSPGADATPQVTAESRSQEGSSESSSASANTPEAMEETNRPVSSSGRSEIQSGAEVLSAGDSHTCRVREGGSVECWGWNALGQATPPAGEFASVSAGAFHSCGVRTNGSVACWGSDEHGQATPPAGGGFASVSAGYDNSCGVRTNGSIFCWGTIDDGSEHLSILGLYSFAAVSVGKEHICGVAEDRYAGLVSCWGWGSRTDYGQTRSPEGETFTSVSAGAYHTCGVKKANGSVICWGTVGGIPNVEPPKPPEGEFASVSAGDDHTCGVKNNGSVVCWGLGFDGQSDPPEGEFASVTAGAAHTCGARRDGSVACWGSNGYGQATPPGAWAVAEPTLAPAATPAPVLRPTEAPAAPTAAPMMPTPAPVVRPTPAPAAATPAPVMPTSAPEPTATPAPAAPALEKYAAEYVAEHAGGPGAIYVGDLNQLVGPGPTDRLGNPTGDVTLSALQDHLWLYESDYYKSLIEKANLNNPTPMFYDGQPIKIQHGCINRALLSCEVKKSYFARNLLGRTNGKLEFEISSFPELGLAGPDTLDLISRGTVESATIYSGYVAGELPQLDILNFQGLYSSREQEFEAMQAITEDIEELVSWYGVKMNHNWHGDQFLFCKTPVRSVEDFRGLNIGSHSATLSDWLNGMGAQAHDQARHSSPELYRALENGTLDCAASWADHGYGERWYEVIDYIIGPLPSFSFSANVINNGRWRGLPTTCNKSSSKRRPSRSWRPCASPPSRPKCGCNGTSGPGWSSYPSPTR